jgi:hypothetical protein
LLFGAGQIAHHLRANQRGPLDSSHVPRPEHVVLPDENLFQLAQCIHFLGQKGTEVLAADFDVVAGDRHHLFLVRQRAQAPLEGHQLVGDVLRAHLVGALLDGRAQLGHLLLIHIRKAPDVLIEVSQLAGGSGDLNVLGAAF